MNVNDLVWLPSSAIPSIKITDDEYKQLFGQSQPYYIPGILNNIIDDDIGEFIIEWDNKLTIKIPLKEVFIRSKKDQLHNYNDSNTYNLTILENYNDPTILDALIKKFALSQYISYAGSTLIIMNPIHDKKFINQDKDIKLLLTSLNQYKDGTNSSSPNIFQYVSQTRRFINADTISQTIVFRGSSGSGKSEALKSVVQYLMLIESPNNLQNITRSQPMALYAPLGSSRNPLVFSSDAFRTNIAISAMLTLIDVTWNAPTQNHLYSTRQAKSLSFIYGQDNLLKGVECNVLLNGMHRLNPKDTLKPYYWFALLLAGVDHSEYMLTSTQRDAILPEFGLSQIQLEHEYKYFEELMLKCGLELDVWTTVLRLMSAILNLKFVSIVGSDSTILSAASKTFISSAEALLGCEANAVYNLIMKKVEDKLGRTFTVDNKPNDARIALETACNVLYEMTFNYLLSICQTATYSSDYLSKDKNDRKNNTVAINLLDTVGWENMDGMANTLSTLNINYMEERILCNFIEHRLLKEINKFSEEEIQLTGVDVPEYQLYLDLYEKSSSSILSILDDITALPRGDDKGFTDKLISNNPKSEYIKKAPATVKGKLCFTIKHSFGEVSYDADGFIYNNRLKVSQQTKNFIKALNIPFLVESDVTETNTTTEVKPKPKPVIGGASNKDNMMFKYKEKLLKFIAQYDDTQVHHVLCIRPKSDMKGANEFDPDFIGKQVTQLGLTSLLQLGKAGFSSSRKYVDFFKRYRSILSFTHPLEIELSNVSEKEHMKLTKELLEACLQLGSPPEKFDDVKSAPVYGKTRIFLKTPLDEYLEKFRSRMLESKQVSATMFQNAYRMHVERRKFSILKTRVILAQSVIRKFKARTAYLKKLHATTTIKNRYLTYSGARRFNLIKVSINIIKLKFFKRYRLKMKYTRVQAKLHAFQELARGLIIRKRVVTIEKFVIKIQNAARNFIAKLRWFNICTIAAKKIQGPLRGRLCRLQNKEILSELTERRNLRKGTKATVRLQSKWRGRLTRERVQSVLNATITIQRWTSTKMQRKRYLAILRVTLWLQCHARRIRDRNTALNKQIRVMLKEIQIKLLALRDQELAAVNDIPIKELYMGSGTARLSGSLSAKYNRRVISFDVAYDIEIAYPKGWLKSIETFSHQLNMDKKRSIHKVAVGSLHTIIIDNLNNVYSFGINDEGQLGINNRQNQPTPRLVENTEILFKADAATLLSKGPAPKLSIEEVCCGNDHTLIRTGFGRVFGFGGNRRGQLGVGNFDYCGKPKVISSLKNVKKISCGAFHSSCIVDPGLLYVWGAAECLGQETPVVDGTKDASVPLRLFIENSKRVYNVCCGEFQTIASCSTGVYSWGSNKHGELGIGDKNSRIVPTKVILPEMTDLQLQSASISTGGKHIAYTVDGSLWMWGWNKYGQLGNVSTYDLLKPALVQMPSNKAIAMTMCSRKSTTVLLHSGEIYMFGLSTLVDTFSPGRGSIPVLHPTLICSKTLQEKYCSLDIINSGSMSVISVDVVDLSLPAPPPSPLKSSSKVRAFDNVYQTESIKEISFTLKPDDVQSELSKQMGKMMIGKVTNSKTKTTATTSPLPSQERIPRFFKKKDDKIKVPEIVVRRNTIKAKRRELEKNVSRDDYFALFNPLISLKSKKNENEEKIME